MTRMSQNPAPDEAIDNSLSTYWFALSRDCPGKLWWKASAMHPAIFRALKIDREEPGAIYAAAPFRLAQIDGAHVILAAWSCPRLFGEPDPDWLGIEDVMAWDPKANAVHILGETEPRTVGKFDHDNAVLYGDPFAFFRAWAEQRAALAIATQSAARREWAVRPTEFDRPGMLVVGDVAKVRWNPAAMPADIACVGIDPRALNKALLKAAHVPRARAAHSMRRVA